jgi:hypothetical protein
VNENIQMINFIDKHIVLQYTKESKETYQQFESIILHDNKMKIESIVSKLKSRLNHLIILISLTL